MLRRIIFLFFIINLNGYGQTDPLLPNSNFIRLPGGTFLMGSPQEEYGHQLDESQHQVTLTKSFSIMDKEITQRQWLSVLDKNPSEFSIEVYCSDTFELINEVPACPEHPIDSVSYKQVAKFIKKLNKKTKKITYSLPTEAQWEYAARAGSTTRFFFGNEINKLHLYAWFEFNSFDQTHQSGQLKPNAWGLHDMYGNVLEWTQTWFYAYTDKPITDPIGPKKGNLKIIRGGTFNLTSLDMRSAARLYLPNDFSINQFGFRLIKVPREKLKEE